MPKETYIVSNGDSIPSIAKKKGFFWKTLWDHGDNAALKQKRKNPNVLLEGDKVVIPELRKKTESKPADAHHKFVRKGEPVKIVIKLLKSDGSPRANEAYVLTIDGKEFKGNTDGDGQIKQSIPNDAKKGILSLDDGKNVTPVNIGGLDPVDETIGVQQRLRNLGYDCQLTHKVDDATTRALQNFQSEYNLDVTGKIDDATKGKLQELSQ